MQYFPKLISVFLLTFSGSLWASHLQGDYCAPAKTGTMVIRFLPGKDNLKQGYLSMFHVENNGQTRCLVGMRKYSVTADSAVDTTGLKGTYHSIKNKIKISEPTLFESVYEKTCGPYKDPCVV